MARLFNPDDFGEGPNCLMYALTGITPDPKKACDIFTKFFNETNGNASVAFYQMCDALNIKLRKTPCFSESDIAIAWYVREIKERDYEGIYHTIGYQNDYHVIRKRDGVWREKNGCFSDCSPSNVPSNELDEWSAGSTSSTQMAYYAI